MWGSEFTTKAAALKGDSADFIARLKHNFCDLTGDCETPLWNSWYYLVQPLEKSCASAAKMKLRVGTQER